MFQPSSAPRTSTFYRYVQSLSVSISKAISPEPPSSQLAPAMGGCCGRCVKAFKLCRHFLSGEDFPSCPFQWQAASRPIILEDVPQDDLLSCGGPGLRLRATWPSPPPLLRSVRSREGRYGVHKRSGGEGWSQVLKDMLDACCRRSKHAA